MDGPHPLRKWVGICLGAVFVLILIGSMVRSTGAGLGCPDWPKCFGLWIPPFSESQLPPDYLQNHDGIPFNPIKTWTEYFNRLSGVVVGVLVTIMMIKTWAYRRKTPLLFFLGSVAWLLVVLNGGIGAWVVSSRLIPFVITLHMLLALGLVAVLTWLFSLTSEHYSTKPTLALHVFSVLVGVQIFLGIEVRELMDLAQHAGLARMDWLPSAGAMFWIHRSFSWLLLPASLWLFISEKDMFLHRRLLPLVLIGLQMMTGIGLAHADMLFVIQPLHLLLSALMVSVVVRRYAQ